MSFQKFRHAIGRLLGIRRYVFMAEPGKSLDLNALLGPRDVSPRPERARDAIRRKLAELRFRPRGAVHFGSCSEEDLAWYASSGFSSLLVLSAAAITSSPPGFPVHRRLPPHDGPSVPGTWEGLLAGLTDRPDAYTFMNFTEAREPPPGLPSFVEAVRSRHLSAAGDAREAAVRAAGRRLNEQGLNLAWFGVHDGSGGHDALYLRRPVVTMSDFGRNGRFGNQLFQRTYLRLVARRQGAILQLPPWAGTALFGTEDPLPSVRPMPITKEEALDVESRRRLLSDSVSGFKGLDFSGYGMMPSGMFAADKEQIRAEHVFDQRLTERFDRALSPFLAGGKKLIVIHLRRGDYGYGQFFRAPCAWYQEWIARQGFAPAGHAIFICSEDPGRYRGRFPGFTVVTADELGTPATLAPYFDFLAMTRADALAVANSSFSFFAAMLNARARIFVRPDASQARLVAFDPWDAEPLLDQKLSPEEHGRLKEID
jgi:hypothetical protein